MLGGILLGCPGPGPTVPPDDEESATVEPKDAVEKAALALAEGDVARALSIIEEALAKEPDNHELWFSKGVALRENRRIDDAVAAWTKALELEPGYAEALYAIGAVHLERQQWEAAVQKLNAAAQSKPGFAGAHYNLGVALLGLERDEDALRAMRTASELEPKDVDVLLAMADIHARAGRLDEALPLVDRAVEPLLREPTA